VATGKPNYPGGRIFTGYEAKGEQREVFAGNIPVVRVPIRPRKSGAGVDLALNYLSFAWSGFTRFPRLLADTRPEVILVFAPSPILQVAAALPLKWRSGAHLAIWVQDLWPESLAATGHVRSRILLSLVGVMVRLLYASADTLLVQSRAFVEGVSRYVRREKAVYYPNSLATDGPGLVDGGPLPPLLDDVLRRNFCVVFAGNLGSVQAIPTVVEAARLLDPSGSIRILLVGTGSMVGWVKESLAHEPAPSLMLFDRQPPELMPKLFAQAGALLATLKNDEVLGQTVPSKLQAYLAAGRPVIAAMPGEGARLVEDAGAGFACMAEDPRALVSAINRLATCTPTVRERMGRAGRAYFVEHFEIERQAVRLIEILNRRMAN